MEAVEAVEPSVPMGQVQTHEQCGADEKWHKEVTLDLCPHPEHKQPLSIERDFGMTEGRLRVTLRAAMAGHVLRQWQGDCYPDTRLTGRDFRLRLSDPGQLEGVSNAVLAPGYVP